MVPHVQGGELGYFPVGTAFFVTMRDRGYHEAQKMFNKDLANEGWKGLAVPVHVPGHFFYLYWAFPTKKDEASGRYLDRDACLIHFRDSMQATAVSMRHIFRMY
jgi:hypothetical protein